MYYEEVFKALNKNRIKYLVIGGIAVNLYGLHRLTGDLDLMIDVSEKSLEDFIRVVKKLGYRPKAPIHKWKNLTALTFYHKTNEFKQIDIFLKNPIDFNKAYKSRKIFRVNKLNISCISFEDLIKLKKKSDRERDLIDIGSLERIKKLEEGKNEKKKN